MEPEEIICQLAYIDMALDRVMRHADEVIMLLQEIINNTQVEACQGNQDGLNSSAGRLTPIR